MPISSATEGQTPAANRSPITKWRTRLRRTKKPLAKTQPSTRLKNIPRRKNRPIAPARPTKPRLARGQAAPAPKTTSARILIASGRIVRRPAPPSPTAINRMRWIRPRPSRVTQRAPRNRPRSRPSTMRKAGASPAKMRRSRDRQPQPSLPRALPGRTVRRAPKFGPAVAGHAGSIGQTRLVRAGRASAWPERWRRRGRRIAEQLGGTSIETGHRQRCQRSSSGQCRIGQRSWQHGRFCRRASRWRCGPPSRTRPRRSGWNAP